MNIGKPGSHSGSNLAAFALGWSVVLIAVGAVLADPARIGVDSHAYWMAWRHGLYGPGTSFGEAGAYLYSPAFAASLLPLAALPLRLFQIGWFLLSCGAWAWLLAPVRLPVRIPLLLACAVISLVGNVEWLIALSLVLAARWPSAWAIPMLTKVSFGVGILWYVARAEWRKLAVVLLTLGLVALVTAFLPWLPWLEFLVSNAGGGYVLGFGVPTWLRAMVAGVVIIWGARTDRFWAIPFAMVLVSPNIWVGTFTILAAVPRMPRPRRLGPTIPASAAPAATPV